MTVWRGLGLEHVPDGPELGVRQNAIDLGRDLVGRAPDVDAGAALRVLHRVAVGRREVRAHRSAHHRLQGLRGRVAADAVHLQHVEPAAQSIGELDLRAAREPLGDQPALQHVVVQARIVDAPRERRDDRQPVFGEQLAQHPFGLGTHREEVPLLEHGGQASQQPLAPPIPVRARRRDQRRELGVPRIRGARRHGLRERLDVEPEVQRQRREDRTLLARVEAPQVRADMQGALLVRLDTRKGLHVSPPRARRARRAARRRSRRPRSR